MTPLQNVHLRINDAATGQPTPCRVRLTGPDGTAYAPFGRLTRFATGRGQDVGGNVLLGGRAFWFVDGSFEVSLPPGPVRVEVSKGPEYQQLEADVSLTAGQLSLRLAIERWTDTRADGWYSGDTRCHFLGPDAALLEAEAEDVAVVNLLITEHCVAGSHGDTYAAVSNVDAFSGQKPAREKPGYLVVVNSHNTHPVLGSLGLLNTHRVVYPLSFGGPEGGDDWTLAAWCQQCHRKGGLAVWTRPWHEGLPGCPGEAPADVLLGSVDALEIDYFEDSPFDVLEEWYTLLNCGCRLPAVGASGKDSNGTVLGAMRTYARLAPGEALTYGGWIEAVRAGRTFVTNGPLLNLEVEGVGVGGRVEAASGATLRMRATVRSRVPFDVLELVVNGSVVATTVGGVLEAEVPAVGGWVAARCRGQHLVPHRPAPQRLFAHTSPVYMRVGGQRHRADASAARRVASWLDTLETWTTTEARCTTEKSRAGLLRIFRDARAELERRLA